MLKSHYARQAQQAPYWWGPGPTPPAGGAPARPATAAAAWDTPIPTIPEGKQPKFDVDIYVYPAAAYYFSVTVHITNHVCMLTGISLINFCVHPAPVYPVSTGSDSGVAPATAAGGN